MESFISFKKQNHYVVSDDLSFIQKIVKKMSVKANTIQFQCERCGKCCESLTENGICIIPLTKKDVLNIRKLKLFKELKKEGKIMIKKGEYDYFYKHEIYAKGLCPFFDKENISCHIYENRPEVCKKFICV